MINNIHLRFEAFKQRCASLPFASNLNVPVYNELGRQGININQNQGGTVYPFDGHSNLAGIVSDIFVTFVQPVAGTVFVEITRTGGTSLATDWHNWTFVEWEQFIDSNLSGFATQLPREFPRLVFTNEANEIILDTDDLNVTPLGEGFWFFSDMRGRNTVRYSEYTTANDTTLPLIFPQNGNRTKLVSRCWAAAVKNIYHVDAGRPAADIPHRNDLILNLIPDENNQHGRIYANVEDKTITLSTYPTREQIAAADGVMVRTINQQEGDTNNNFYIEGDGGCLAVTSFPPEEEGFSGSPGEPYTVLGTHEIGIRNDCAACCGCDEYAFWINEINRLGIIHAYEVEYLKYLTEFYYKLYDFYNSTITARLKTLVKVRCIPGKTMTTVGFSISNPSNQSIYDLTPNLKIVSDGTGGMVKRIMVYDAIIEGDYPSFNFRIPEIAAHSTWSGAISFCWDNCGYTAEAIFSNIDLPWCEHYNNEVRCTSVMSCDNIDHFGPPIQITPPRTFPINIPAPPPPPQPSGSSHSWLIGSRPRP